MDSGSYIIELNKGISDLKKSYIEIMKEQFSLLLVIFPNTLWTGTRSPMECFILLRDLCNDIDLVVLPSHNSHITQPLDLILNHFYQVFFFFVRNGQKAKAGLPFSKPELSSLTKWRRTSTGSCTVSQFHDETVEEAEACVSSIVYRITKLVRY